MSDHPSLLPLHIWLSPTFPIGAFAYSQGLERAVEDGWVRNADTLEIWLDDLVVHGAIYTDCILLALSLRAADAAAALEINELALALTPSHERRLETAAQGTAFLSAVAAAWPAPAIVALADALGESDIAYPVAVGVAAAAHGLAPRATLEAFALAGAGNLVSAALRLGPIGQSEAQAILAHLCPALRALAATAETSTIDALGACAFRADIAAMRHETQYSRLFRS